MSGITTIGLDADDTLWHNETIFAATHERFRTLIGRYVDDTDVDARLLDVERANLAHFGYGVKGYTLSLIETAVALTDRRVSAGDIGTIIDWAKEMTAHPTELLDGVAETVKGLAADYRLVLITKGDLLDQENKVARSGLVEHFDAIEIVSEKDESSYGAVLARHDIAPATFVMVGNSVRSDVLPVVALGGRGVHIPYHITWEHEAVEASTEHDGYVELADIRELPDWLSTV